MSQLVRKQVDIESRHKRILKRAAAETGLSEAELIRQAIDLWQEHVVDRQRARQLWAQERAFVESWVAQGAVSEGRSWTRDELYEERVDQGERNLGC